MADSKSLRHRFSDSKTFKQYEPDGNISKQLYKISEKIRCEKIGTSYFKGVKNNIETFYQERVNGLDLKSSEDKIVESFENYLRTKFLDFENNSQIDKKLKSYKKDFNGEVVITKLNKDVLETIAQLTGGVYQNGNNTKEVLDFVSEQLKAMDKKEFEAKKFVSYKDQFQAFLFAGFILILLELFLFETKTILCPSSLIYLFNSSFLLSDIFFSIWDEYCSPIRISSSVEKLLYWPT